MIELNFGTSEYVLGGPISHREPDMVINIPAEGELMRFPYWVSQGSFEFEKVRTTLSSLTPDKSRQTLTAVEFPLQTNQQYDIEKRVIMPWIEERREWVALVYHKWVESMPRNDERYSGPFRLNEYCQRKLLEAYGVSERKLNLKDVHKTNPSELEKLAGV